MIETTKKEEDKKLKAALYIRVSTTGQDDEEHFGPEVQLERGQNYCKSQGFELEESHIYKDTISGSTHPEKRTGLTQLLKDAEQKEFDVVLVYKIDRLARNLKVFLGIIEHFEALKVIFRSVTEPIDTSTPVGQMVMQILAMFAQFERGMIRERTLGGKLQAAKQGNFVTGVATYGYRVDKTTKRLVIEPEQAKIVKKLFHWAVDEKLPLREIEKRMNQLKVSAPYVAKYKKRKTLDYWHKRTIGRILTNETYTGNFFYRKYKRPFNNLTSITDKRMLRPKEDWIPMETQPIITREMFEAAKTQLLKNRELARRNQKRDYMYAKLIYCGVCGYKMFSGYQPPTKKWPMAGGRYYHGTYHNDKPIGTSKRCKWCPVYAESRLEPIWECLKEILKNPKNMFDPLEKYIYREESPENVKERLEQIAVELSSVQIRQSRVDDLYINGQIDKEKYSEHSNSNGAEEKKLNDEANRLRQSLLTKKEKAEREVAIGKAYEKVKVRLDDVSYEEKMEIVRLFVERITLYAKEDYASVVFRFPSSTETATIKLGSKVSEEKEGFPLVLNIKTMTLAARQAEILRANPLMYFPRTLV
ncbi:MAG: Resolvase domain protein [Parcubacteria group bacterium GW2011_GWC1_34_10]|uniref:Resolvase/invertase-type recombinase catalytic domain-containing protein n=1 Tax=Candidatus Zambryskibacteria bacterium RIFCSPLOWO2_01_FULL_35_19 TaxID=1802757 RepID=A0A1G2U0B9_9BACT|nr:MAG: Resolvase domain protein [Parcubacteria group bacterium GW2011_GWC1_34_10]OHA86728.1 MAG: hypothetical protein A2726_00115 [Candidatus Zambryskibacteria bacterium RIFCSPHIGHO2_01_FULL_35_32]OHB02330.1 MAG: hypothetical protein A3A90_00855 [Candidatus Zambryskibacteria bacterium RIFCSPLOWO2_01_FULL_35_19]